MSKFLKVFILLLILVSFIWLISFENNDAPDGAVDTLAFKLGEHSFEIPQDYLTGRYPIWLNQIEKILDKESEALVLRVPLSALPIAKRLGLPSDPTTDIIFRILALKGINLKRSQEGFHLHDLTTLTGSYEEHRVEPNSVQGWYNVYRSIEYPYSWAILKKRPGTNVLDTNHMLSNWVGQCLVFQEAKEDQKQTARCNTYRLLDNLEINYSIRNEYIEYSDQFAVEILELVDSWRTK